MGKAYKYILVALVAILLGAAAVSLYFYGRIERDYNDTYIKGSQNLKYHFSIIISNSSSLYWQEFMKGAHKAAEEYGAALEYHAISPMDNGDEAWRFIKIAVASRIDGIITNALDEETYADDIAYVTSSGLHIVTTGADTQKSQTSYYVGTMAYEYGLSAARLAIESAREAPKIALIVDETVFIGDINDPRDLQRTDSWIIGFLEGISAYNGAELLDIKKKSSSVISAEDVVQSIFDNYPDVNAIFCMTPEDTVTAAQAVTDRNKVGEVVVTGTDLSLTTPVLKYMEKNIIYGYIDRNPSEAGYRSVEALVSAVSDEFQAAYVDIDIDTITKENINEHLADGRDG